MLKDKFDELKLTGSLPSPSAVGLKILQITQREDYDVDELTDVIQIDPALTGRIIKIANSAAYAGSETVSSVGHAAMRIGVRKVRGVALGFTLVSGNRTGSCPGFDYERYWSWSLACAVSAQVMAREMSICDPIEAFTCSLLSRIGRLALAAVHPEAYSKVILDERSEDLDGLLRQETRVFDINHLEVAAAMIEDWGMPEGFVSALVELSESSDEEDLEDAEDEEEPSKMGALLRAAWNLADLCLLGGRLDDPEWRRESEALAAIEREMGFERGAVDRVCEGIRAAWPEWGEMLGIPTVGGEAENTEKAEGEGPQAARKNVEEAEDDEGVAATPAAGPRTTILAVDDDAKQLRLLTHYLGKAGYEVLTATNGEDALKLTIERNPQIVVTDWMMPGMSGLELCKVLRMTEAGRSLYVLILTAREDEERIVEAFNAGADDYVAKPFNPRILLARVGAGKRLIALQTQVDEDKLNRMAQVAEMGRLNRKLRAAAWTDVLTELPNRRYGMKRLEEEWTSARRVQRPLSTIMLDIDHFKRINDTYGHDVGDVVLRETARVLRTKTRRGDVVCRLGGEEFLVINVNCRLEMASVAAERLRTAIESNMIQAGDFDGNVTVSLGVAQMHHSMSNIDDLLKASDEAAYRAKAGGRNRVEIDDYEERDRLSA